jgi:hypothetical protein
MAIPQRLRLGGCLMAAILFGTVLAGCSSPIGSAATADISGTLRFYAPFPSTGFPNGVLRAGFVEFRSSNGLVTKVQVPRSGTFIANLAPGTYTVRGHLAKSNLWCDDSGDRTIRIVKNRELHIRVNCDGI